MSVSKDKCVFNKILNGNQITLAVYSMWMIYSVFICVDSAALDWIEQVLKAEFKELNVVREKFILTWDRLLISMLPEKRK